MNEGSFNLESETTLYKLNELILNNCDPFDCGVDDLNEFFIHDAITYDRDLMGKTYCWLDNSDDRKIIAMIKLANAGIQTTHMPNNPKRHLHKAIAYNKQGRTYPAVLIGRLGVNKIYQGAQFRIGAQIMSFIKDWFISSDNKTGCRFILVDAVNDPHTLAYYERNGFKPLFPRAEDEKVFYGIKVTEDLRTRMFYYDLLTY